MFFATKTTCVWIFHRLCKLPFTINNLMEKQLPPLIPNKLKTNRKVETSNTQE